MGFSNDFKAVWNSSVVPIVDADWPLSLLNPRIVFSDPSIGLKNPV